MMSSRPRILLVGAWQWPWYEAACANALTSMGCEVQPFGWFADFWEWRDSAPEPFFKSFSARVQNKLLNGPIVHRINRRLLAVAREMQPDIIWFYNAKHIFPRTIEGLRRLAPKAKLAQYANDNPFSHVGWCDIWRHVKRAVPQFDIHFVFRHSNLTDFQQAGARRTEILRSYYIPETNFRSVPESSDSRFFCDVVFAGHFENDGRAVGLEQIMRAGLKLNLFGGGWGRALDLLSPDSPLRGFFPVRPVVGEDYRNAISGAKIALCFLSKLNRDTYTTRNFEIPAMKTFMLSEYTDELASMFEPGVEADYFRSNEELVDKAKYYATNDAVREAIAQRGFERLIRDGHDVKSRMRQFLNTMQHIGAANFEVQAAKG